MHSIIFILKALHFSAKVVFLCVTENFFVYLPCALRPGGASRRPALCFSGAAPRCSHRLLLHQNQDLLLPQMALTEREEQG